MTKQVKIAFELNVPCSKTGVMYTGQFLEKLDSFIRESGITFIHNDNTKFVKLDFVGIITGYNILKDKFIILNLNIMNERFNALNNIDGYIDALPKVIGQIDKDGVAVIERIEAIELII